MSAFGGITDIASRPPSAIGLFAFSNYRRFCPKKLWVRIPTLPPEAEDAEPAYFAAGGATAADWLLRLSALATKPEAFKSSTNAANDRQINRSPDNVGYRYRSRSCQWRIADATRASEFGRGFAHRCFIVGRLSVSAGVSDKVA